MTSEYPKKYWWVVLVVIPIALAVVQIYPSLVSTGGNGNGNQQVPPVPMPPPTPAPKPAVKEIVTSPSRISLEVGDTGMVRAELRDTQGNTLSGPLISWGSGNSAIATVSASGRVTAMGQGITVISAESEGVVATTEVTVTPVPLAQIRVLPEKDWMFVGSTFPLKVEMRDKRGNIVDRPVNWDSKNPDFAHVSTTGVVKGKRFGIVEIVAESEGIRGCAKLFIGNPKTGMYPIEGGAMINSGEC